MPGDRRGCRRAAREAAKAVTSITGGNFRLIERLMTQIDRGIDISTNSTTSAPTSSTPPGKCPSSATPEAQVLQRPLEPKWSNRAT